MPFPTQWVIPPPRKTLVVGVADMAVSNDPSAELVTYSLGSCLGIAVYDPGPKLGGLLHVMLPDSNIDSLKARNAPFMFVDTGVPRLFHALYSLGASRHRLVVKVVGGAQVLDPTGLFNIGERNQQALDGLLGRNGYAIQARDVGGMNSRTVRFDLSSGNLSIRSPWKDPYSI
jgi:chemotaxis protein CheD